MQINEIFSRINDNKLMDKAISFTLHYLSNKEITAELVEHTLKHVGISIGVKNIKHLYERFHDMIKKGRISSDYAFFSSAKLRSNDPRLVHVTEELDALLELIEPQVQKKDWRGNFYYTRNSYNYDLKPNKEKKIGSGNFSNVENIPNDPHLVRKTSHSPVASEDDAYWKYVNIIIKNKLWENPYFPRVYDIKEISDRNGHKMYRGKIERLVDIRDVAKNKEGVLSLATLLMGHDASDAMKVSSNSKYAHLDMLNYVMDAVSNYIVDYKFTELFEGLSDSDLDDNFVSACKTLRKLAKDNDFVFDVNDENMMLRRVSYGYQLVFSDPFSFK